MEVRKKGPVGKAETFLGGAIFPVAKKNAFVGEGSRPARPHTFEAYQNWSAPVGKVTRTIEKTEAIGNLDCPIESRVYPMTSRRLLFPAE